MTGPHYFPAGNEVPPRGLRLRTIQRRHALRQYGPIQAGFPDELRPTTIVALSDDSTTDREIGKYLSGQF